MKKFLTIVIWVVALVALLTAAYTFYNRNKSLVTNPPLVDNTALQGSTAEWGSQPGATDMPENTTTEVTTATGSTTADSAASRKIEAPDFTLKDLDGNEVKLSDYRGKIVILNFWAVWCKYCKQEMPDLNELNKELEKGSDAVLLAVDVQETPDVIRDYLTTNNITLKVLLDEKGSTAGTYGVEGYPTTFVIDKDGSVYTYIPGATDLETLHTILDKVRKGEPLQ